MALSNLLLDGSTTDSDGSMSFASRLTGIVSSVVVLVFAFGALNARAVGDPSLLIPDGGTATNWSGPSYTTPWADWNMKFAVGDVNNDRKLDALSYNNTDGSWRVGKSNGNGFNTPSVFITGLKYSNSNFFYYTPLLGDVNGDGRADAVLDDSGTWRVALANASATQFGPTVTSWASQFGDGTSSFLADVNGDGRSDAITVVPWQGLWKVALSTGSSFGPPQTWASNFKPANGGYQPDFLVGDVTGDARADAVFARDGTWKVAESTGSSFGTAAVPSKVLSTSLSTNAPTLLGDINGDGRADGISYANGSWSAGLANIGGNGFASPVPWNKGFPLSTTSSNNGTRPPVFAADVDDVRTTGSTAGAADLVDITNGTWMVKRAPTIQEQITQGYGGYSASWGDEFGGTALDTAKWNDQRYDYWLTTGAGENGAWVGAPSSKPHSNLEGPTGTGGATESFGSNYSPANNTVSGGTLKQKLTPSVVASSTPYLAGSINSLPRINSNGTYAPGGHKFDGGYVEARVKVPNCAGCWPALWMLPAPTSLTANTFLPTDWGLPEEVDIFEFLPTPNPYGLQYFNVHWPCATGSTARCNFDQPQKITRQVVSSNLTGTFHTYGFLWMPSYVQFFVDGIASARFNSTMIGLPKNDMYLISTLQHYGGIPTTSQAEMETDYIRFYE